MKFSVRAEEILNQPRYSLKDTDHSKDGELVVAIDSDKKLTLQYRLTSSILTNLSLETWSILLNKRNPKRIMELSFKEYESFLRDDNGQPAFDSDTQIEMEKNFSIVKEMILNRWPWADFQTELLNNSKSYTDKLRIISHAFELINDNFNLNSKFKLVHFEYEFIYYYNKSELDLEFLCKRMEYFLTDIFQTPIKLVAVRS